MLENRLRMKMDLLCPYRMRRRECLNKDLTGFLNELLSVDSFSDQFLFPVVWLPGNGMLVVVKELLLVEVGCCRYLSGWSNQWKWLSMENVSIVLREYGRISAVGDIGEYYVEESRRVPDCSRIHRGVSDGHALETLRERIGFGI
jgi:hypothetical protein